MSAEIVIPIVITIGNAEPTQVATVTVELGTPWPEVQTLIADTLDGIAKHIRSTLP